MKKTALLLFVLILSLNCLAQDKVELSSSPEKNVLKINTLSLFLGTGSLFYERKLSDMVSAQVGVGYLNFKLWSARFNGLILTPEVRIHPRKDAIDGFYMAPYLRYQRYNLSDGGQDIGSLTALGGGFLLGRQWITKSGFTMDLFFGGHYGDATAEGSSDENPEDYDHFSGFRMRMGFALGFAF